MGLGSGKPKTDLVRLDNMNIYPDGSMERTTFFDFLKMDLSDYSDIILTSEEALSFKNAVIRMSYGTSAAIPLKCSGERCMNYLCPLHKNGKYPLARQCIFEVRMIEFLNRSYIEDLEVDPETHTEMVLINKLVECDIIDFRANLGLSGSYDEEAGRLLKTTIVETDQSTSETTNLHPLIEAKEKAQVQRSKILELFAATRKEKYKKAAALKKSEESDSSQYLAELKKRIENNIITVKHHVAETIDG